MTSGTEQQRAVGIAERSVVRIGGNSVGAGLLLRERDIVVDAELGNIFVFLLSHLLLKQSLMLMAYGEVNVSLACA